MGHLARLLEEAGIATVIIGTASLQRRLDALRPPRVLYTPFPLGRPLGAPNDPAGQRHTLLAALHLLQSATRGQTVVHLDRPYLP